MPMLQKGVAAVANRMPKVISPTAHAVADYATIALWGVMAGLFWNRNKRAAVSAMICGASELGTSLITDYPGGVADVISLATHLKIDMGLAATATALPNLMGFDDDPEAKWFRIQGLGITGVTAMTRPTGLRERRLKAA
ncbi:MAG TPA: hypothetical protein VFU76_04345 [Terriglobales bacterium]|nr:hypothetical protein [Terriglobales bacterium]